MRFQWFHTDVNDLVVSTGSVSVFCVFQTVSTLVDVVLKKMFPNYIQCVSFLFSDNAFHSRKYSQSLCK